MASSLTRLQESVGANVRRWRLARGLTQEEFAKVARLDLRHVQRIEGGTQDCRLSTVLRVADALDVTVGVLVRTANIKPRRPGRPTGSRKTAR